MIDSDGLSFRDAGNFESETVDTRLLALVALATAFGVGHHLDHVSRGTHAGWPLIPEVTVFTYSLGFYPLIAIGLYLTLRGRAGADYWLGLSAGGFFLITLFHFGPWAVEPPRDIVGPHETVYVGYFAVAWVLGLAVSLLAAAVYAARR